MVTSPKRWPQPWTSFSQPWQLPKRDKASPGQRGLFLTEVPKTLLMKIQHLPLDDSWATRASKRSSDKNRRRWPFLNLDNVKWARWGDEGLNVLRAGGGNRQKPPLHTHVHCSVTNSNLIVIPNTNTIPQNNQSLFSPPTPRLLQSREL